MGRFVWTRIFRRPTCSFGRWTIDNAVLDKGPDQNLAYFRTLESTRNQWITLAENHIFLASTTQYRAGLVQPDPQCAID